MNKLLNNLSVQAKKKSYKWSPWDTKTLTLQVTLLSHSKTLMEILLINPVPIYKLCFFSFLFFFQKLTRVGVETLESQPMARGKAQASDMETNFILSVFQPLSWWEKRTLPARKIISGQPRSQAVCVSDNPYPKNTFHTHMITFGRLVHHYYCLSTLESESNGGVFSKVCPHRCFLSAAESSQCDSSFNAFSCFI